MKNYRTTTTGIKYGIEEKSSFIPNYLSHKYEENKSILEFKNLLKKIYSLYSVQSACNFSFSLQM